jgi:hypothetical protein
MSVDISEIWIHYCARAADRDRRCIHVADARVKGARYLPGPPVCPGRALERLERRRLQRQELSYAVR